MYKIILTICLFVFLAVRPFAVHAQSSGYNNSQTSPSTGKNIINSLDTTNSSSSTTNTFDWRWLLPLLAIPVIYFIWQAASAPERGDTIYPKFTQPAMGVKGGRTIKRKGRKRGKYTNKRIIQ